MRGYAYTVGTNGLMPLLVPALVASMCVFAAMALWSGYGISVLVALALAPLFAVAVMMRPEVGILVVVLQVSSIFDPNLVPLIPSPLGGVYISDAVLLLLLFTAGMRPIIDRRAHMARSPLNLPMTIFLVLVLVSGIIAVVKFGVYQSLVQRQIRTLGYYALFFAVVNLIRDRRSLRTLLSVLTVVACLVSLAMVAQAVLGTSVHITTGRVETLETIDKNFYGVTRVLPPGQTLIFAMFMVTACTAVLGRSRKLFTANNLALLLLAVALGLTFNRNYWVAAFLSLVLFAFIVSKSQRVRMLAAAAAFVLAAAAVLPVLISGGGRAGKFARAAVERANFLFEGRQVMKSRSLEWRAMENRYALERIRTHPVLGIGLANRYRPELPGERDSYDLYPSMPRYVHNGYIWMTLTMGGVGLAAFLWLCVLFLRRGLTLWRTVPDERLRAAAIGFTLSFIGMLAAAVVNPVIMQWFSVVVIGLMMGMVESSILLGGTEAEAQGA